MDKLIVQKLHNRFDSLSHAVPDKNVEFWFARELQEPLGYAKWERFKDTIQRAITSCEITGYDPNNHFRGVTEMVAVVTNAESFSLLTCCFRLCGNCKNTYEILASRIPNRSDYKSCLQILLAIFSRCGTVVASKASLVRFDAKPRAIRPSVNLR